MFLNLIGLVCVSLCSLLSLNNREVEVENISKPTQNILIDNDEPGVAFVYSATDIANERFFWDISAGFKKYEVVEVDVDDNIMPLNNVYTLPVRQFYCGSFVDFYYSGGYPYNLPKSWTFNYIKIQKISHYHRTTVYLVGFVANENDNIDSLFSYRFRVVDDFDYVVGCISFYGANVWSNVDEFCFFGIGEDGNQFLPFLPDILTRLPDREFDQNLYDRAYNNGVSKGYQDGYNEALALEYDETAVSIFSGIMSIALVPINMFLNMFNFEVFGINLAGFVSGFLTIAVIVIIIRFILGGKNSD